MLTIPTTPEIENQLRLEAQKQGLKTEDWALWVLKKSLSKSNEAGSDEEFEAALNEATGFLADFPAAGQTWREYKDEEMALEEAKYQRLCGKGQTR